MKNMNYSNNTKRYISTRTYNRNYRHGYKPQNNNRPSENEILGYLLKTGFKLLIKVIKGRKKG